MKDIFTRDESKPIRFLGSEYEIKYVIGKDNWKDTHFNTRCDIYFGSPSAIQH